MIHTGNNGGECFSVESRSGAVNQGVRAYLFPALTVVTNVLRFREPQSSHRFAKSRRSSSVRGPQIFLCGCSDCYRLERKMPDGICTR